LCWLRGVSAVGFSRMELDVVWPPTASSYDLTQRLSPPVPLVSLIDTATSFVVKDRSDAANNANLTIEVQPTSFSAPIYLPPNAPDGVNGIFRDGN
jgi:hypothetical protein